MTRVLVRMPEAFFDDCRRNIQAFKLGDRVRSRNGVEGVLIDKTDSGCFKVKTDDGHIGVGVASAKTGLTVVAQTQADA
jgi:hypothetical protein